MAEANPKVMEMVQAEIKKNPAVSNEALRDKAIEIDKDVAKLSPRQFNARYPLQVKRTMGPKKKSARKAGAASARGRKAGAPRKPRGGQPSAATPDGSRDKVRALLLELARDVANAPGKGDIIDVVAGIDRYVDRVLKAAG